MGHRTSGRSLAHSEFFRPPAFRREDRTRACAEFVVRYVGFIGKIQARLH
jgi:hypothetical protein